MLKEFSRKYYERSCGFNEYTKPIDPTDFIKYDGHNLWKTSYDVMCEHIPKIEGEEGEFDGSDNALKTDVSPILAKRQAEAEKKVYYDPLKKYATIAETEGSHPERNPLNNHKLIQNSYFPMSRLIGSYWDKVDKVSYFRDRYDKLEFNPEGRDLSPVFHLGYYINNNPDVANIYGNNTDGIIDHFLRHGIKEGRPSSPNFNLEAYKQRNEDLKSIFQDNNREYYYHYCIYGKIEGRPCLFENN